MSLLNVDINETEITISTNSGVDILHWFWFEWELNPDVTVQIARSIQMAYTEPTRLLHANFVARQLLEQS